MGHDLSLPTLQSKPSWLNRAGRIDRSACFELRASELRHRAIFPLSGHAPRLSPAPFDAEDWAERDDPPQPPPRPHSTSRPFLLASATATLTAAFLENLRSFHLPRTLSGDWRTSKSNAMKTPFPPEPPPPVPEPVADDLPPPPDAHHDEDQTLRDFLARYRPHFPQPLPLRRPGVLDYHLTANPNKGAAATKTLALDPPDSFLPSSSRLKPQAPSLPSFFRAWEQLVRLELWYLHPRLSQHFLICPTCEKKFVKLYLPLCTPDEHRDALFAFTFLRSHFPDVFVDAMHAPSSAFTTSPLRQFTTSPTARALLSRYSLLFPPRRLLCRHCLGVRYGEVKRARRRRPAF